MLRFLETSFLKIKKIRLQSKPLMLKLNEKIVKRENGISTLTLIEAKPMAFALKQIMDKQTHIHTHKPTNLQRIDFQFMSSTQN